MLLDRPGIAALIPHDGAMCLLDGVLAWDATHMECITDSHRAPDNPLRRDGMLGVLCGVEYAAQAMALHGALSGGAGVRGGALASLRGLTASVERLDVLAGPLLVAAERLHGEADRMIYGFALRHDGQIVLKGRAAVALA